MKRIATAVVTALIALLVQGIAYAAPSHVEWSVRTENSAPDKGTVIVTAKIESGWHIYGLDIANPTNEPGVPDATSIEIEPQPGLKIVGPTTTDSQPVVHFDEFLNLNLPWLQGTVELRRDFELTDGAKGAKVKGYVKYMACNDNSCTPPAKYEFDLDFGDMTSPAPAADVITDVPAAKPTANIAHDTADANEWWEPVTVETNKTEQSYWAILLFGFLGGLVALMTPCVWPMIPMTVSFFLKKNKNRRRSIADAIIYSASIIVIFLVLGILLTVIFGPGKLNEIATGAVFNIIFFVLLVVFAISFFGAFDLSLPSSWSTAIDNKAESTTGLLSIFFMAFTLVLVSFSCTGPIIGTLLVEAFSQQNLLGPLLGMGGFAIGLALPFGLFAFFPSMLKGLPHSGGWLNTVKVVLGFIELILSLKFLSVADLAYGWRILDREVFIALWIVLFVLLSMYLLGKLRFSHDSPMEHTPVGRFFLALGSFAFAVYLVPGLWGAPLKAISAFAPPLYTQDFNLYGGEFQKFHDYDEGMAYAAEHNKPVLVDFSGYACVNCRKMEGAVFDTPAVRGIIERDYVMIVLMVDDKQALPEPVTVMEEGKPKKLTTVGERWSYLQYHKFGISSQPYYILLDNHGKPLSAPRVYDENVGAFTAWLEEGIETYKQR